MVLYQQSACIAITTILTSTKKKIQYVNATTSVSLGTRKLKRH